MRQISQLGTRFVLPSREPSPFDLALGAAAPAEDGPAPLPLPPAPSAVWAPALALVPAWPLLPEAEGPPPLLPDVPPCWPRPWLGLGL